MKDRHLLLESESFPLVSCRKALGIPRNVSKHLLAIISVLKNPVNSTRPVGVKTLCVIYTMCDLVYTLCACLKLPSTTNRIVFPPIENSSDGCYTLICCYITLLFSLKF